MSSRIIGYVPTGYSGRLVRIDVDIRRGIPGLQIIGLPEGAVREARERVRTALSNCGFGVIGKKILVGLGPADIPKASVGLDLAIALAILDADADAACLPVRGAHDDRPVIAVGELGLHGNVLPVHGVLAAVDEARQAGAAQALVPGANIPEAELAGIDRVGGVANLNEAWSMRLHAVPTAAKRVAVRVPEAPETPEAALPGATPGAATPEGTCAAGAALSGTPAGAAASGAGNPEEALYGTDATLRALEIAAAGKHHLGLFGPPGTGKTLTVMQLPRLMPPLLRAEVIQSARIHSLAGLLARGGGVDAIPPVRTPHHSATVEGMIGGGSHLLPGEVSLAHNGVLVLDEIAEFQRNVLQALREPLESREIRLVRANMHVRFPAAALTGITANLCPCGGLGKPGGVCACSPAEVSRYWRKFGGAVMDRIAIRVVCAPGAQARSVSRALLLDRVAAARARQHARYRDGGRQGVALPYNGMQALCDWDGDGNGDRSCAKGSLRERVCRSAGSSQLSFRGVLHAGQLARTIADLEGCGAVRDEHIEEALALRSTADGGTPWNCLQQQWRRAMHN